MTTFSEEARSTVRACRFCWMCRHICPVGQATSKENDNPRAKALFVFLDQKGAELEADMAGDLYQCALCGACAASCETGYEPAVFIREARSRLAADGLMPEKVCTCTQGLLKNGTLYGVPAAETLSAFADMLRKLPTQADTAVYLGAAAALKAPEEAASLLHLLDKAGVKYTILSANPSSGAAEYDLLGNVAEVRRICTACADAISATGANRVVVLDPSDAVMLIQRYPAWGIELKTEVVTATSFLAELVQHGALHVNTRKGTVVYHDPCRLARDLGETAPARQLLRAMGFEIREMLQSKKLTRCCGGEVLAAYSPELSAKMADLRIGDAKRTGASVLVTACPGCYANLSGREDMETIGLFTLLDRQTA